MQIGEQLRALREARELSQGDIEKRTGLLRCYISRVENGHTVPAIETLEKLARAIEVSLYQFFYQGEPLVRPSDVAGWGSSRKEIRYWNQLYRLLPRIKQADRQLLLDVAQRMGRRE